VLSFAVVGATHAPARASQFLDFPSNDCPEAAGLQACIDKTTDGDFISILATDLADQDALVTHSLTIQPEAGLPPTLGRLTIDDSGRATPLTVQVKELTFDLIQIDYNSVDGNDVELHDVNVVQDAGHGGNGMGADVERSGSISWLHGRNVFAGYQHAGVAVDAGQSASLALSLVGLRIRDASTDGGSNGFDP